MKNKHKILMFQTICKLLLYIYAMLSMDDGKVTELSNDVADTIIELRGYYGES